MQPNSYCTQFVPYLGTVKLWVAALGVVDPFFDTNLMIVLEVTSANIWEPEHETKVWLKKNGFSSVNTNLWDDAEDHFLNLFS